MSEEALKIAEEIRELESKGERERLNAEFKKIARRNKKAFFNEQCKEIEENNRMKKIYPRKLEIAREHFMQKWAQ